MKQKLINLLPWSLRNSNQFLNSYGDKFLFGGIIKTPPIETNPNAEAGVHSAVPHRYLYAYLVAIKSLLRYHQDLAIYVHDDGSLTEKDKALIHKQLPGVIIIDRTKADSDFEKSNDPFLSKIRKSYTSYLKLFDTTFFNKSNKILILDTDTLFIKRPDEIITWITNGGPHWFHLAPKGQMKAVETKKEIDKPATSDSPDLDKAHIQTLIMNDLDEINETLDKSYCIEQGFCSGFIGYQADTIKYDELHKLFDLLYKKFGEKIFLWGSEQTTHGLLLCSKGAKALPLEKYFVVTQNNADQAYKPESTFLHFVGENRFYRFIYPKLAKKIISELFGQQN